MASDPHAADFPAHAGFIGRLRDAWQVLRGVARSGDSAGAGVTSGRPAGHPAARLIESLIAGLPGPAIVLDRDGRVVAFNPAALGLAPAMRRGDPALISLRMPELVNAIRRASRRREPQRVEFFERVPRDRWYEAFVRPVRLAGGEGGPSDLLLMTFNDLTPLRRVEEMRADFIANASHELRTPLAALLGFIETLQGRAKDDPAAREKFLAIMQAQATRMARLIDDLLSLSRIELNAHLQPSTPVDLATIVRQVVDGLQMLARDRAVEIKVSVPAEQLIVLGERDELIRALENLVENALKYGAAGKRVDVTLTSGQTRAGSARGAARRARLRSRHRARASAAPDRALLPRRRRRQPPAGRYRTGVGAGQTRAQPPWRQAHHREHAGPGRELLHARALIHRRNHANAGIGRKISHLSCHLAVIEAL